MVVSRDLRGLLILNTVILGSMFMFIILFSIILKLPSTTNETILIAVMILDLSILLYKSGNSLDEYNKYFEGLGTGITGCIFSALGIGILIKFVSIPESDFYFYLTIFVYTIIVSVLYIVLNEIDRKKRTKR